MPFGELTKEMFSVLPIKISNLIVGPLFGSVLALSVSVNWGNIAHVALAGLAGGVMGGAGSFLWWLIKHYAGHKVSWLPHPHKDPDEEKDSGEKSD